MNFVLKMYFGIDIFWTLIPYLLMWSRIVASNSANLQHERITLLVKNFKSHYPTIRNIVFHIDDPIWLQYLTLKYKDLEWSSSMSIATEQDPFAFRSDKKRTLNVYLRKNLNNLHDWFDGGANITTDYWLVQMKSNDQQEIQKIFSSYKLLYTTLLFPFHYTESFINIWETYKLAPEISEAILLNFGNVTDSELQLTSEEIWQRRQNMRGHFFRATSLPNKPYVTEVSNGCKSQECFKGTVLPTLTIFTHSDL